MDYYTAAEAARLLGLSERTIRNMIKDGRITGAIKHNATRYDIPAAALPAKSKHISDRVAALEAEIASLKASMQRQTPYNGIESRSGTVPIQPYSHIPHRSPVGQRSGSELDAGGSIVSRAALGRFLARHGVGYNTARLWLDCPMQPGAALRYAADHLAAVGWRARGVRLTQCGAAGCDCLAIVTSA